MSLLVNILSLDINNALLSQCIKVCDVSKSWIYLSLCVERWNICSLLYSFNLQHIFILTFSEVSPLHDGCLATEPVHIFCILRFSKLHFFAMYFLLCDILFILWFTYWS
jgi:hypothetical protein